MRINKFLAQNTELSRRKADDAVTEGRVLVNNVLAKAGDVVIDSDTVSLDGHTVTPTDTTTPQTIMLNKPKGYVVSKDGQGSSTVYDLLPKTLHHLNPAGRLDKDSSGLLIMTNDGTLLNQLTHPSSNKDKIYTVTLNHPLTTNDLDAIKHGVNIGDKRPSKMTVMPDKADPHTYRVSLTEGRNRQIRRTFEALGISVTKLHRTDFGPYTIGNLPTGKHQPTK